jgi:hypothetical protein
MVRTNILRRTEHVDCKDETRNSKRILLEKRLGEQLNWIPNGDGRGHLRKILANVLILWELLLTSVGACVTASTRVRSLIKFNATVTSRLPAGTAWLTFKRYKVYPIQVKYRSIKTIKSPYISYDSSCRDPASDNCVQRYQWTHCTIATTTATKNFSQGGIIRACV